MENPLSTEERHGAMLTPGRDRKVPVEALWEEVRGGAESDSPDLGKLRAAARGEIQAVFVFEHSRLSWNPVELFRILDELPEAGVDVRFWGTLAG